MDKEYNYHKMIFPIITEETTKLPFYVTGVGSLENQHYAKRTDGLHHYQILYTSKGKGILHVCNKEYEITSEKGFYLLPSIPHEYYAIEEPWTTWWVTFNGYALKDFSKVTELGEFSVFYLYEAERLFHIHSDIRIALERAGLTSETDASIHLYKLILEINNLTSHEPRKQTQNKNHQLQTVMTYMINNFADEIALNDLAVIAGISSQHFCRLFKQKFNMRPFEYLTKLRLQKAKEYLVLDDSLILKEIISKIGYNDISYFCLLFKQYEGMTPMEFRQMHKKV